MAKKTEEAPKTIEQQGTEKEVVKEIKTPKEDENLYEVKTGADFSSVDAQPKEIDKEHEGAKEALKRDEDVKKKVTEGKAGAITPAEASELQKPMVAELNTGRPVYETASQANAALAASGDLYTSEK